MVKKLAFARKPTAPREVDPALVLNTLAAAVLVLDQDNAVRYVNASAEQLFESGAAHLCTQSLGDLLPIDSPVFSLIEQARGDASAVSEYGVTLDTPRTGHRTVGVQVASMLEEHGWVVLSLVEQSIALKIGAQLTHRNAARSVTAMAAILAHEVKNPLSGIRGAAQLLEQSAPPEDRPLTRLICDEADRIVALVDRMEVFSDQRPLERDAINIHSVLEHVRRVAQAGFGRHVRFVEQYDPSLPAVFGNRDQLIQVFLNLIKNAAEAVPQDGGEIILSTAYQHGVRLAVPGTHERRHLPLVVSVLDNGGGIPDDVKPHLFDAFVTTKATGTGLGLALVAKIIGDHGGIIEFDSMPRRTVFKVMLPMVQNEDAH
ncbi:MAG: PAS domain-containing protein [Alphaproteobacteria bacterium]|nr:PAS domain-containing protein [Alphaproteobacteria bacterium]